MDAVERISRPVLSLEELEAQLRDQGKSDEEVQTEIDLRQLATAEAQARYDKSPPAFYRPVPEK